MKTYLEAEEYLLDVPRFTKKNTLEDTSLFLESLGNPGIGRKVIHVAGTNGKGSVCVYLCSILSKAGYRVGMFSSPHLVEMRERFRIDGTVVGEEAFVHAFTKVSEHIGAMRTSKGDCYHPTFFEFLFFMGMLLFEEEEVDYILLETGLGGRLDATNVVPKPVLTVITEIGMDHMEYLGETIPEIAMEKAGILKPGVPVVFCDKRTEASKVIIKRAKSLGIQAFSVSAEDYLNVNLTNKSIDFSFRSRYYDYIRLMVRTKALYQVENAAIAARCIEVLNDETVTLEHLRTGIESMVWEGRMEEVMPGIYLEGAHNEDGIYAFLETVKVDSCEGKRYLLFSAVSDKDYASMVRMLSKERLFHFTAVTKLGSGRAAPLDKLCEAFAHSSSEYEFFESTKDAFTFLLEKKKEQDSIYIAGSLYLVGEIKELLRRRTDD